MQPFSTTRRRRTSIASTLLTAAALLSIAACSDDDEFPTQTIPVAPPVVVVTPGALVLDIGQTQQLSAQLLESDGGVIPTDISWSSADPDIVTVSSSGLVTAVGPGNGSIIASTPTGTRGAAAFTVLGTVGAIEIEGSSAPLAVGSARQLFVEIFDSDNDPIAVPVTWTSSDPSIVMVNDAGIVIGVGEGTATITATAGGMSASFDVQSALLVSSLSLSPDPLIVARGASAQVTAVARDGNDNILPNRPITWTSSNAGGATVSSSGLVSVGAMQFGSSRITATTTDAGGTNTASILVNPLRHGTPVTAVEGRGGQGNAANTDVYTFLLNLPAGRTSLTVSLSGGTGDPDLYIFNPAGTNVCARENGAGVTETCTLTSGLTAGTWRISVEGWTNFAGWTLTTTIAPTP